ncbi:MAG: deoxyribose-phosphate aldolase [Rhodobacteraceae bacterium]|jgi:deoxyribose-phosphate aldolase|nr:MAG: deoxyribose-phosphate aldolase [Paracoccaceae bacterium]|tara:strand:- start:128 stop:1108 length:981 start_codon:yes stop_codon:yes gene_type:complete
MDQILKHHSLNELRNQGLPYDEKLFLDISVNMSAIERRCATAIKRRAVKKESQVAWLLKAISCIDLTTLSGDDTPGRIRRLCAKAKSPIKRDLVDSLDVEELNLNVGAVCVYHDMITHAKAALAGSEIPIAAVSTGFPAGLTPFKLKVLEIHESVAAGADEIDVVISRKHVLNGDWKKLYDEVKEYKSACGSSHLKTILATGELGTLRNVAKASWVCMMAGADFIKTSTGKESINATLPVTLVMLRAIRDFYELTGQRIGYKPAGGISKAKDSINYLILVKEELGRNWLTPNLFRFGASSLLADIERQLEFYSTGNYSAFNRHGIA